MNVSNRIDVMSLLNEVFSGAALMPRPVRFPIQSPMRRRPSAQCLQWSVLCNLRRPKSSCELRDSATLFDGALAGFLNILCEQLGSSYAMYTRPDTGSIRMLN